jgi:hypothetical protein
LNSKQNHQEQITCEPTKLAYQALQLTLEPN